MSAFDDTTHDANISLSAVAQALSAFDTEMNELMDDAYQHYRRFQLALQKLDICHKAMVKIVEVANYGEYPSPVPKMRFPELNHPDTF